MERPGNWWDEASHGHSEMEEPVQYDMISMTQNVKVVMEEQKSRTQERYTNGEVRRAMRKGLL